MKAVTLALFFLPLFALAAPVERDLGEGLVYFRAHAVPADLPGDEVLRKRPCVLDLRYTRGDANTATLLSGWLKFHASPRTPIFVLVNGRTAAPLLAPLRNRDGLPGVLVIGVAAQRTEPDLAVQESAADERRAYDALENGSSVLTLTTDNPTKQRNDEASLAHDRSADPAGDTDAGDTSAKAAVPADPRDAALQEAIHLYRALRAMKKV